METLEIPALDATEMQGVVELPAAASPLFSVGGPIVLAVVFVLVLWIAKATVPFRASSESLTLYHYPTGVKRGLALALCLYGIAFLLGALDVVWMVGVYGSSEEYFRQMPIGEMLAFTHAHLFGFTTSFLVIGVPFSMQFNHLPSYQWIFPVGLAACFTDVVSWWGLKYVSGTFVTVSIVCGILFSACYLYMLVGLLRVLLFPEVVWPSDRDWREQPDRRREI